MDVIHHLYQNSLTNKIKSTHNKTQSVRDLQTALAIVGLGDPTS